METFLNSNGAVIVHNIITVIQENAAYLSEIDGAIGDGDHGINMSKGMTMCQERLAGKEIDMTGAMKTLGRVLLMEIGGSMGPLYGTFFREMAKASQEKDVITPQIVLDMLKAALAGVQGLGNAKVGDKTLVDTMVPAIDAYEKAMNDGQNFQAALDTMKQAAEAGKDSTKDLVAKVGRSSRLGERSRGVLDAGATSCWLILKSMADSMIELLSA
ncbi:dihydroxyacetone kinase subunit L [candidate division KSB3 bacterium]|uniref:Dihydroxyacetone kinase subunit L n=1 Tax=candidate division KSB3 bacterium TaxID=2044937 RepID=A0A2G6K887_9BACT|nr:MAG: dihydroxyacetone kinase subunit L [candidate division KSB3 bacterium]